MEDIVIKNYNELYEENKISMWLDLSTYCNAKCPQCHRTDAKGLEKVDWLPLIQWSYEEFVSIFPLKTLNHIERFDICGTWGDPIMNKDIFKIVEYIIQNTEKTTVLINTNGSLRNSDWWWDLGLLSKERIQIMWAVEGITQEQHSLYRQNTSLQTILDNMISFSAAGGYSQVFTVTFKHNENDLYDIALLVKEYGAKDIFFVQSNRFYENQKFNFIDKNGTEKSLEKTNRENSDFYWKTWNLYNEKDLGAIYRESRIKK
jgi:MoaA/NifB/PqqE/SkfB family radical SAM enzyme